MLPKTAIASILLVIAVVLPSIAFAANPSSVISPSQNIQDPGASSTPWGGCGPTDSNCYVDLTTGNFTSVTVSGPTTLIGATNINTSGSAATTIGAATTTTTINGATALTGAVTFSSLPNIPLATGSILFGNGSNQAAPLAIGANGQVLQIIGGLPAWAAIPGDGGGTVTSIDASGGTTGLTFTGGPITTSGLLTLGGTLGVVNGGTGATSAVAARTNLGAAASGANSDITNLTGLTGITLPAGTVSSSQIVDGTIVGADIASGTILNSNLANSSFSALVGTTGTDVNVSGLPVALGGTLAINIPTASSTNRGALSTIDWVTFNSKLGTTLADGELWIGNGSNIATAVTLSGDATVTNAGVISIEGGAVTLAKLAADAVNSSKIVDGSITNADVSATAAIVYSKLALGNAITLTDLTANAVDSTKIADGSIVAADLATDAVTSLKVLDGTLTNADIATTAAIAYGKLNLADAIASADLTDGTIATSDVADGAITNAKLANATIGFATGTTGTDINITGTPVALGGTVTVNIPDASGTARGVVTTGTQTFAGNKTFTGATAVTGGLTTNTLTIGALSGFLKSTNGAVSAALIDLANDVAGLLPISFGGTGSGSVAGARTNLGAAASGANSDITSLIGLTTALSVPQGGTGATTLTGVLKGNGTGPISGMTGTSATLARWTDANTLASGSIFDDGTNIGIGSAPVAAAKLLVDGETIFKGPQIDVRAYGAVGDGTTNDRTAIQAAVTAATARGGATVYFPKTSGDYRVDSSISVGSNTRLLFEPGARINFTQAPAAAKLFTVHGTLGSSTTLTADAAVEAVTVTVADTTAFAVNDLVVVTSSATFAGFPVGEYHYVKSKTPTTLTLQDGLFDGYLTADTARIYKINAARNVVFENATIVGRGTGFSQYGIELIYADTVAIKGLNSQDMEDRTLQILASVNVLIDGATIVRSNQDGLGYGVAIAASQWLRITNSYFADDRHAVSSGGSLAYFGPTRFLTVTNNQIYGAIDAGLDAHHATEYLNYSGNTITNASGNANADGIIVQGAHAVLNDNVIRGAFRHGIAIQPFNNRPGTFTIAGNMIHSPGGTGIAVSAPAAGPIANLSIAGNTITGPGAHGILVQTYEAGAVIDQFSITGNAIASAGQSGIYISAELASMANGTITGNTVRNSAEQNIYLVALNAQTLDSISLSGNALANGNFGIRGVTVGTGVISNVTAIGNTYSGAGTKIALPAGNAIIHTNADKLGIGTTAAADKLDVQGDIRVGTGTTGCVKDADGSVIAGTCSSDERLKTDITPLTASILDKLIQVQPVTYRWNTLAHDQFSNGTIELQTGLVAQQVEAVFPELISNESPSGYKQVRFSDIPIYLVQSLKEMWTRITVRLQSTDARVAELERRLAIAEGRIGIVEPPAPIVPPPSSPAIDATAPVVTLNGEAEQTITVGQLWSDLGASANDNVGVVGDITVALPDAAPLIAGQLSLNTSVPGEYIVTYAAHDAAGNVGTTTRSVRITSPIQ